MNHSELKKLVHSEFLKSIESLSETIPEKLKEHSNSSGNVDISGAISLCITMCSEIACDAVLHVFESVLPLDD